MTKDHITTLQDTLEAITADDLMPVAGRKIFKSFLIAILKYEADAQSGEDPEGVHRMRVVIRRMRSAMNAFKPYYQRKALNPHQDLFKVTARKLGEARDLDVIIHKIEAHKPDAEQDDQSFDVLLSELKKQQRKAYKRLRKWLNSSIYQQGINDFVRFLLKEGKGNLDPASPVEPYEMRHVVPLILHEQLAIVRAYDRVIQPDVSPEVLHNLRIEGKRLRYLVEFFEPILGSSAGDFITDMRAFQDYLGALNDDWFAWHMIAELAPEPTSQLGEYHHSLEKSFTESLAGFGDVWASFNSRSTQTKLVNAMLVLR